MLYWRRLDTSEWDHKLMFTMSTEVINQVRTKVILSLTSIQSDHYFLYGYCKKGIKYVSRIWNTSWHLITIPPRHFPPSLVYAVTLLGSSKNIFCLYAPWRCAECCNEQLFKRKRPCACSKLSLWRPAPPQREQTKRNSLQHRSPSLINHTAVMEDFTKRVFTSAVGECLNTHKYE